MKNLGVSEAAASEGLKWVNKTGVKISNVKPELVNLSSDLINLLPVKNLCQKY